MSKFLTISSTILWLGVVSLPATGAFRTHMLAMSEGQWFVEQSPLLCRLWQDIPDYGRAEFSLRPKQPISFKVHVHEPATGGQSAEFHSYPMPWSHFENARNLGPVPVLSGKTPFFLGPDATNRVIAELRAGMSPTLVHKDWVDGRDEVRVSLHPLNLEDSWRAFQSCFSDLLPYTFSDVKRSVFQYKAGQVDVGGGDKSRLDQIIDYVKKDTSVKKIRIDGYTDSKGLSRVNKIVAKRRAELVKQYLVKRGIPASKITTVGHDELAGPFSNRTASGRAKNRRVVVQLSR